MNNPLKTSLTTAIIIHFLLSLNSCANGQSADGKLNLSVSDFAGKINSMPNATILDVRTPKEFASGHLRNATNVDWNNEDFSSRVEQLDKSKPVFVYCLSGARSTAAANKMRADGFKEVYQMDGGIMKWRANNLPETNSNSNASPGMSKEDFEMKINSEKIVLVDFYADWCEPCKRMKHYLDQIATDRAADVLVIHINVEKNQSLCKELKVETLPVLQVYKNKNLIWNHSGFADKVEVLSHLK
ncbi:MAG: thioredoxin domain-containing protein [Saprospiraceae bacterium]